MKKNLFLASILCAFAVGSFAQTPADVAGAKLVAERDAAYAKTHPSTQVVKAASAKTVAHTKHKAKGKMKVAAKHKAAKHSAMK